MKHSADERRKLRRQCEFVVPGFAALTPADEFAAMAEWCRSRGIEHDLYGTGEVVEAFEKKIAALLGKPSALFVPSGIMAQSIAVRLWTESARLLRFGMHPTSHLALHENEAYAALLGCHGVPVGDRSRPMVAADLAAVSQPLACVIVEMPIREAGGQLPSWDELEALMSVARALGIPLHMDGARLWECATFYGKSHAEIADGFASVYVSLYKGIGAWSGAMLAGDEAFIANARLWRRRFGGTLYHLAPMLVSAAMRFDKRLASMPALYERAVSLAGTLANHRRLRLNPIIPQTNLFHLHFDAPADAVMDARDRIAAEAGCWLFDGVRATDVPGSSVTEIYVGDQALKVDDARLLPLFDRLFALTAAG